MSRYSKEKNDNQKAIDYLLEALENTRKIKPNDEVKIYYDILNLYDAQGKKEVLIEGQKQKIIVSGVIRPYDITSDNSINSAQIADLKLLYDKEGTEADILETPWGLKFMRMIWPF